MTTPLQVQESIIKIKKFESKITELTKEVKPMLGGLSLLERKAIVKLLRIQLFAELRTKEAAHLRVSKLKRMLSNLDPTNEDEYKLDEELPVNDQITKMKSEHEAQITKMESEHEARIAELTLNFTVAEGNNLTTSKIVQSDAKSDNIGKLLTLQRDLDDLSETNLGLSEKYQECRSILIKNIVITEIAKIANVGSITDRKKLKKHLKKRMQSEEIQPYDLEQYAFACILQYKKRAQESMKIPIITSVKCTQGPAIAIRPANAYPSVIIPKEICYKPEENNVVVSMDLINKVTGIDNTANVFNMSNVTPFSALTTNQQQSTSFSLGGTTPSPFGVTASETSFSFGGTVSRKTDLMKRSASK